MPIKMTHHHFQFPYLIIQKIHPESEFSLQTKESSVWRNSQNTSLLWNTQLITRLQSRLPFPGESFHQILVKVRGTSSRITLSWGQVTVASPARLTVVVTSLYDWYSHYPKPRSLPRKRGGRTSTSRARVPNERIVKRLLRGAALWTTWA